MNVASAQKKEQLRHNCNTFRSLNAQICALGDIKLDNNNLNKSMLRAPSGHKNNLNKSLLRASVRDSFVTNCGFGPCRAGRLARTHHGILTGIMDPVNVAQIKQRRNYTKRALKLATIHVLIHMGITVYAARLDITLRTLRSAAG